MIFTVNSSDKAPLLFVPETLEKEISQNIALLLSCDKNSVPLARKLGMSGDYIGRPAAVAESLIVQQVHEVIEAFEPRAKVIEVNAEQQEDGKIKVSVDWEVQDAELS